MRAPFAESPEFQRLVQGEPGTDLTRIALEIARDAYPELDPDPYLAQIDSLAARVHDRCPADSRTRHILGQINWVLFVEEGFRGNTDAYYDPRNSYLNDVMDRRTGIPISLSVLYLALADRLGLPMSGVNLPAHFLIRTGQGDGTIFVDPFHAGALLDRQGCEDRVAEVTGQHITLTEAQLRPCPHPLVVARMLRNLKAVYLQGHEFLAALPVLRRLVALSRNDPQERRDLGTVCIYTGQTGEAIDHLRAYLKDRPEAADSETVEALLRTALRDVAERN